MATVITGVALRKLVSDGAVIEGGLVENADGVKYDFRMGSQILKAKYRVPMDMDKIDDKSSFVIEPGEVVFVLSAEQLHLTGDMFAQLSPKRSLSQNGILVVGGFEIDPGYSGRLMMGLYNFSSTTFPLIPDRKLIAATFYRLEGNELGEFAPPRSLDTFPPGLIEVMSKYQPIAVQSLTQGLDALRNELSALRKEIDSHTLWYQKFEESLDRHDQQIGQLLGSLASEKDARERGEDKLSEAVRSLQNNFTFLRGASWVIGILLALIALPLLVNWVSTFLAPK